MCLIILINDHICPGKLWRLIERSLEQTGEEIGYYIWGRATMPIYPIRLFSQIFKPIVIASDLNFEKANISGKENLSHRF